MLHLPFLQYTTSRHKIKLSSQPVSNQSRMPSGQPSSGSTPGFRFFEAQSGKKKAAPEMKGVNLLLLNFTASSQQLLAPRIVTTRAAVEPKNLEVWKMAFETHYQVYQRGKPHSLSLSCVRFEIQYAVCQTGYGQGFISLDTTQNIFPGGVPLGNDFFLSSSKAGSWKWKMVQQRIITKCSGVWRGEGIYLGS